MKGRQDRVVAASARAGHEYGPIRDVVLLNAGAALYCAGVAASVGDGVRRAREAVASGRALAKLSQFVSATQRLGALT